MKNISPKLIEEMKAAICYHPSSVKNGTFQPIANLYGTHEYEGWEHLVEIGLAGRGDTIMGSCRLYYLTRKGQEYLSKLLSVKMIGYMTTRLDYTFSWT